MRRLGDRDAMNWKGPAGSLVTKRCIQIGRVSAVEYLQGAFGQKAAPSAIEPEWLFRLVRTGTGPVFFSEGSLTREVASW